MIKFSVITVTKNAAATLDRAIKSVAAQRYPDVEYIVVDGASSDATAAVIARHRNAISRCLSEPDHGIYDAMNKGLNLATGDFVYFLGADDYLIDDRVLSDVAAFLEAHPESDFVYGGLEVRCPNGDNPEFMPPPPEQALEFMICGCLPHQASFASRHAFEIVGGFDLRYRIAADYDWFLRVLTQSDLVTRRLDRIVASYRMDGVSNRLAESQHEVYAIQNALRLFQQRDWVKRRLRAFRRELLSQRLLGGALANQPGARKRSSRAVMLGRLLFLDGAGRVVAPFAAGFSAEKQLRRFELQLLAQRIANDRKARGLPIATNAEPDGSGPACIGGKGENSIEANFR